MTIALICLLLALIWLLTVIVVRAAVLHRRLVRSPDVFACSVRVVQGRLAGLPNGGTGRSCRGEWKHAVLVLHCGFVLTYAVPLAVRTAEDGIEPAGRSVESRLGSGAIQMQLRLDDGSIVLVAAPADAVEMLAGPFFAAAVRGLPPGMTERRRHA